jgi:prepilin-type processing-associated H-X9-DG protein
MYLWPYIEQTALAEKNDYTQPFYVLPGTASGSMDGLCGQYVALYDCPMDSGNEQDGQGYERRRGNYVVNWGNTKYDTPPPAQGNAPFYHDNGDRSTPHLVRMENITDGASQTLMLSEYLKAVDENDDDWRGDIHNDDGVFRFHTITTPNSTVPDVPGWFIPNFDPLMPATDNGDEFNAARSRHFGGVNACFCDGSVHFIGNDVGITTWKALGTMDGDEVITEDFTNS